MCTTYDELLAYLSAFLECEAEEKRWQKRVEGVCGGE